MAKSSAAERTLRFFGLGFARLIYRVTATGLDHLPPGGFLLLPNHITWVDAIVLMLASPRPIRFIIDAARLPESVPAPGFARGRLHPDHFAQSEGRDARSGGQDSRGRDRLPVPRRRALAQRVSAPAAARLRNYRATGGSAGCSRLARPALGLDLFLPRRTVLYEMAQGGALPGHGRVWPAAAA